MLILSRFSYRQAITKLHTTQEGLKSFDIKSGNFDNAAELRKSVCDLKTLHEFLIVGVFRS